MGTLTEGIDVLERLAVDSDEDTTSTLIKARIANDPGWLKPLVIRQLRPAYAVRAERFCATLERWMQVVTRDLTCVFVIERGREPFAVQDYAGPHTLAGVAGVALAPGLAEQIMTAIDRGLAALHAAGLAHGDVRAGCVSLRDSVQLMVGRPWCGRATQADDRRQAAALRARLIVDRRGVVQLRDLVSRGAA